MKDSFNNEIKVGDRILCLESRKGREDKRNQISIIIRVNSSSIVVEYEVFDDSIQERLIRNEILIPDQDIFIKIDKIMNRI